MCTSKKSVDGNIGVCPKGSVTGGSAVSKLVGDVFNAHLQQCADMVVIKGIIYGFSLAPVFNDSKGS